MNLSWSLDGWNDYLYWQKEDKKILKRINLLIKDTLRNPTEGIGKPEKLRHNIKGYYSRRITDEHRLVYRLTQSGITVISCRYHYSK